MTVIKAAPKREPATAILTDKGTEYEVIYLVTTNDPLDGPQKVLSSPLLPKLKAPYALGNDVDATSFLQSLSPRPFDDRQWEVTCKYAPEPEDNQKDNGDPSEDPLQAAATVEISFQQFTRQVTHARFVSLTRNDLRGEDIKVLGPEAAPVYREGDSGRMRNSAGEMFEPSAERDDSRMLIRITRNEATWKPIYDSYMNAINSDKVTLTSAGIFLEFNPGELKMQNIQAASRIKIIRSVETFVNGNEEQFITYVSRRMTYWQISYELSVKRFNQPEEYGWHAAAADIGYHWRARAGVKDGNFGTVSADSVYPQNAKVPFSASLKDFNGFTAATPQPLNGHGDLLETEPAGAAPAKTQEGIGIVYQIYEGLPFSFLNL